MTVGRLLERGIACLLAAAYVGGAPAYTAALTATELANKLVAPIHPASQPGDQVISQLLYYCSRAFAVPVGPPRAVLSVVEVYPELRPSPSTKSSLSACTYSGPSVSAQGAVLLVPGIGMPKAVMLPYANALAAQGYRALMIDLRAQGASTGAHLGYGWREAKDLRQLIIASKEKGDIAGDVGILGISYGAAVALNAAALDSRITAIVAVAPFAYVGSAISGFIRLADPGLSASISDPIMRQAQILAGHLIGYPLADASPIRRVNLICAPVLYIVGTDDQVVPLRDSLALFQRTDHAEIIKEPGATHLALTTDTKLISERASAWFKRYLAAQKSRPGCPATVSRATKQAIGQG